MVLMVMFMFVAIVFVKALIDTIFGNTQKRRRKDWVWQQHLDQLQQQNMDEFQQQQFRDMDEFQQQQFRDMDEFQQQQLRDMEQFQQQQFRDMEQALFFKRDGNYACLPCSDTCIRLTKDGKQLYARYPATKWCGFD